MLLAVVSSAHPLSFKGDKAKKQNSRNASFRCNEIIFQKKKFFYSRSLFFLNMSRKNWGTLIQPWGKACHSKQINEQKGLLS